MQDVIEVYGGVDTHRDVHVAAVVDAAGRHLDTRSFTVNPAGYAELEQWLRAHGRVERVGVEGTGSYGAGLSRHLTREGVTVVEVTQPNRQLRRRRGKTDAVDAYAAACAAARGEADATPKTGNGVVEAIRTLYVGYDSAVQARTRTANQLKAVVVTAPGALRQKLDGKPTGALVRTCAGFRASGGDVVLRCCKQTLKNLARRYEQLTAEINDYRTQLKRLCVQANPALLAAYGVGCETAAVLLIAAGDNPHRLRSEASFAALCGASPIEASSGKVVRHRLNRGGRRQANKALWRIASTRIQYDPRTKEYARKRTAEGRTRREILRCLKRYIAREVYQLLVNPHTTPDPEQLRNTREQAGISLTSAARALGTYPTRISQLETGHTHNHQLATQYEKWLKENQKTS